MDSQTVLESWRTLCDRIKTYNGVDPSQIDAFFSRLHPQAMSEGFLMVTADTDFIKSWIERHYLNYIRMGLEELFGVPFSVVIEVDPTAAPIPVQPTAPTSVVPTPQPLTPAAVEVAEVQFAPIQPVDIPSDIQVPPPATAPEAAAFGGSSQSPTSSLTFENFVIGNSNRVPYTMAVTVAEQPGRPNLNPLFIYGKSGLGKTHLMRAIQNYIAVTRPELKTVYVDADVLVDSYTEAGRAHERDKSSYKRFKDHYETADVLFIDDVQQLQGKKQTLEIVFQIFNKLIDQGKQVVLSADRAPKNIDIDERYTTRFNKGGTYDIQPPELETKLGIVKLFIDEYYQIEGSRDFEIPYDVQMFVAENSGSNVRELKSAITKIISQMNCFDQTDITVKEVRTLLENHFSSGPSKRLTVADIMKAVESYYKVSHADLIGSSRSRNIAHARHIAIYLTRQLTDLTFADIGARFSGRDHSTIKHSVDKATDMVVKDREVFEEVETLKQIIRES